VSDYPTGGDQDFPPPDAPKQKPKLDVGFFILGFLTPLVVGVLGGLLMTGVASLGLTFMASLGPRFLVAIFVGQIAGWLTGRTNGNNRLRSWGLGGVVAVMAMALAAMLFFGACLISLGNGGM